MQLRGLGFGVDCDGSGGTLRVRGLDTADDAEIVLVEDDRRGAVLDPAVLRVPPCVDVEVVRGIALLHDHAQREPVCVFPEELEHPVLVLIILVRVQRVELDEGICLLNVDEEASLLEVIGKHPALVAELVRALGVAALRDLHSGRSIVVDRVDVVRIFEA